METKDYTIDANKKRIGRVASEAASVLMGKHTPQFARNVAGDVRVVITGANNLSISEEKQQQKVYTRYSGYPGGLKKETLAQVVAKKGNAEVLRKAVYGMLPANKLRAPRMKRLVIEQ